MLWKNSSELLEHAFRELQVAVKENKPEVEIRIQEHFSGDIKETGKIVDRLEMRTITELLREEFSQYEIKSRVGTKGKLNGILSCKDSPCVLFYPLVWELTLQKK